MGPPHDMLVLVYKCVNGLVPSYLSSCLIKRTSGCGLRGARKLVLPKPRTTTHGLNSFTYSATSQWNSLPGIARTVLNVNSFNSILRIYCNLF